ncbi:MAG: hypothetical protein Q9202_006597 [Teloschistes flavicans]
MAPANVAIPQLASNLQHSVMPACETSMGVLASSGAAAFNVRLGFQYGRTTPPFLVDSPSSAVSSSQTVSALAVDPIFVNPRQTEIIKVEGEPYDNSHQNRFHAVTLQELNDKFAAMREGDTVSATDKELWEYFAALYKHSNKGIKGRGKDRRISVVGEGHPTKKRELQNKWEPENGGPCGGVASMANMAAEHRGRAVHTEDIEDVYGDLDETRQSTTPSGFECSMELYGPSDGYV